MSNQHVLKIHPAPLADLLSGSKTAEVRRNDRGFQVGDTVRLMEVNPETGNWTGADDHVRTISHIQTGYGLPDGVCVLSYAQPAVSEPVAIANRGKGAFWVRWTDAAEGLYGPGIKLYTTPPAAGEPVHQWADQDLWMDGDEADLASARAEGFKTRTLWSAPPAAAHGDEAARKDATESAIQRACGVLPEGWSMQIDLERDAGWVTLFNPWGRVVDFGQDFGSIGAHVEAAIDAAMRAQAGEGGEV